ncbi:MAG: hypothetical protein ACI4QC_08535, partial [Thermoguttaceae bacterium]
GGFWKPGQAAAVSDQRERFVHYPRGSANGIRAVAGGFWKPGQAAAVSDQRERFVHYPRGSANWQRRRRRRCGRFLEAGTGGSGQRPTGAFRSVSAR